MCLIGADIKQVMVIKPIKKISGSDKRATVRDCLPFDTGNLDWRWIVGAYAIRTYTTMADRDVRPHIFITEVLLASDATLQECAVSIVVRASYCTAVSLGRALFF